MGVSGFISVLRGVCSGGSALGGFCSGGGSGQGGGIPACTETDTPPVNRITDTSKNITLAITSLRPVNILMTQSPDRACNLLRTMVE